MRKQILLLTALFTCFFSLPGCDLNSEIQAASTIADKDRVWVFAQFNVVEDDNGMDTYYYYGSVSRTLYEAIASNSLQQGFILLKHVKYWDDNIIYEFADAESTGELVFRIEHIVKIERINSEPIAGLGMEQYNTIEPEVQETKTPQKVDDTPKGRTGVN